VSCECVGGPGTWDELWEMACQRSIGFSGVPIVAINVDGFYDGNHATYARSFVTSKKRYQLSSYLQYYQLLNWRFAARVIYCDTHT
jgi:predicted Rossmann-fold nucleotide-binding protein